MKENKIFRGEKIGIVVKDIPGLMSRKKGAIVIYKEEYTTDIFGKKKFDGTFTVESPLPREWIEGNRKKKNLLVTGCTMVGVPKSYVEDLDHKFKFVSQN